MRFIQKEYKGGKTLEDRECMENLQAIFVASYENFGRFNKHGKKSGVLNKKKNPRVLHMAILLLNAMGETKYEDYRVRCAPHLPSYSYIRTADTGTG
jgi:hypothetical protein